MSVHLKIAERTLASCSELSSLPRRSDGRVNAAGAVRVDELDEARASPDGPPAQMIRRQWSAALRTAGLSVRGEI